MLPRAAGPVVLDGEIEEPGWQRATRTGPFLDRRAEVARPYSEARLFCNGRELDLALYAADENIEAHARAHDAPLWLEDAFSLKFTPDWAGAPSYAIDVSASGVVTDLRVGADGREDVGWDSHARVAVDRDGTLNQSSDEDEEWVVEMALPLDTLGIAVDTPFALTLRRCDTPRGAKRACGEVRSEFRCAPDRRP